MENIWRDGTRHTQLIPPDPTPKTLLHLRLTLFECWAHWVWNCVKLNQMKSSWVRLVGRCGDVLLSIVLCCPVSHYWCTMSRLLTSASRPASPAEWLWQYLWLPPHGKWDVRSALSPAHYRQDVSWPRDKETSQWRAGWRLCFIMTINIVRARYVTLVTIWKPLCDRRWWLTSICYNFIIALSIVLLSTAL